MTSAKLSWKPITYVFKSLGIEVKNPRSVPWCVQTADGDFMTVWRDLLRKGDGGMRYVVCGWWGKKANNEDRYEELRKILERSLAPDRDLGVILLEPKKLHPLDQPPCEAKVDREVKEAAVAPYRAKLVSEEGRDLIVKVFAP
jgi:hypothetical protein